MVLDFEEIWKTTASLIESWVTFPTPFEVLEIPIEMAMKAVAYTFVWLTVMVANSVEATLSFINTNVSKVAPDAITGIKDFIKDPAGTILTGFGNVVTGIQDFISDETGPLKNWIDGAGSWVWGRIKDPALGLPKWLDVTKIDLMNLLNPRFDGLPNLIATWFEPQLTKGLETLDVVLQRELGLTKETK